MKMYPPILLHYGGMHLIELTHPKIILSYMTPTLLQCKQNVQLGVHNNDADGTVIS